MTYRVIWNDVEDDRLGTPFTVEAENPSDAYDAAVDYLRAISKFRPSDIECLRECESGEFHWPDLFVK